MVLLVLGHGETAAASPTCITIQRGTSGTVDDVALLEASAAVNQGSSNHLFTGPVESKRQRSLLKFDLSAVPTSATVTSATLSIYNTTSTGTTTVRAHRVNASWTESGATWNNFGPGGSYDAATLASFTTSTSGATKTLDLTSQAQAWVTGPSTNFGVLLEGDGGSNTELRSSEYTTVSFRPKLDLCYNTAIDADSDGYDASVDCNDNDASVHPGAPELCDGKDNDCNGQVDDGANAACADGNVCDGTEVCQNGACHSGTPLTVDDGNPCTVDACDPVTGVSHTQYASGTSCSDGNACNGLELCDSQAQCQAGTPPVVDDGNPCTTDSCNAASGVQHVNVAAGTSCADGNVCNGAEVCNASGSCIGGTALATDDGNPCTTDACDPIAGVSHTPKALGTTCGSASDSCHAAPACNAVGSCQPGGVVALDDGDACTLDSCDPQTGPVHTRCQSVDPTVATTPFDANAWIYSGASATQLGVAPGVINRVQGAVVQGTVKDTLGQPVLGASVRVVNHPEFGTTQTMADGTFRMVLNGGALRTVEVNLQGYIPVQRSVNVPWEDYANVPDVVLTKYDGNATTVDLTLSTPFQVAQGTVSTDADGPRRATALFPAGTTADLVLPNGQLQPLSTLTVRATELTVGAQGQAAMPAALPPTSAYTYAVELSADEALAAGATGVRFSQPVSLYVQNFLHFPVGTTVPCGFYDRTASVWVPVSQGAVVKILSVSGGFASLDTDRDGSADNAATLATWGITPAEQQKLATLFSAGDELWRVQTPHFSSIDLNWNFKLPLDSCPPLKANCPPPLGPTTSSSNTSTTSTTSSTSSSGSGAGGSPPNDPIADNPLTDPCEQPGSTIECENQILGESVPVAGTPFRLHYRSDRVQGRSAALTLDIPVSGSALPASLKRPITREAR